MKKFKTLCLSLLSVVSLKMTERTLFFVRVQHKSSSKLHCTSHYHSCVSCSNCQL